MSQRQAKIQVKLNPRGLVRLEVAGQKVEFPPEQAVEIAAALTRCAIDATKHRERSKPIIVPNVVPKAPGPLRS